MRKVYNSLCRVAERHIRQNNTKENVNLKNLFKFRGFAALAATLAILVSVLLPVCSTEVHLTEQSASRFREITVGAGEINPNNSSSLEKLMSDIDISVELSDKYTDEDREKMAARILEIELARQEKKDALGEAVTEFVIDKKLIASYNAKIISGETLTEEEQKDKEMLTERVNELDVLIRKEFKTTDIKQQDEIIRLMEQISENKGYTVKFSFFDSLLNVSGIINSVKLLASMQTRDNAVKKIAEIEEELARGDAENKSQLEISLKEYNEQLEKALSVITNKNNYKGINVKSLNAALIFESNLDRAELYTNKYTRDNGFDYNYQVIFDLAYEETGVQSWAVAIDYFVLIALACIFAILSMIIAIVTGIAALVKLKNVNDMEKFSSSETISLKHMIFSLFCMTVAAAFMRGTLSIGIKVAIAVLIAVAVYNLVTFFIGGHFGNLEKNEKTRFIVSLARRVILIVLGFTAAAMHMNADRFGYRNVLLFAEYNLIGNLNGTLALIWDLCSTFYITLCFSLAFDMIAALGGIGNKKDAKKKSDSTLATGVFALILACVPLVVNAIVPCLYNARFTEMVLFCIIFAVCVGFKIAESTFGVSRTKAAELMEYSVYPEKKFPAEAASTDNAQ